MDRDKNLLFGVVAVQYDQITSSDFVRAAIAWANEPTKTLSTFLVEADVLCESGRDFVSDLVDKVLNECGDDPLAALEKVGGEEALQLTSRGYITQVGSSGLRVGPPDQQRTDLLETESLDTDDSSVAPVEGEVVPWSLIGFASLAVVLLFVFAAFSYWRIANERDGAVTERDAARQARRGAEERLESAVLQQRSDRDALQSAEDQRRILQRQRNVAKRQKDIALEAVKKSLLDMRGRLNSATDAPRVLRELLKENFAMLDHILELEPDSIDLQMEKSENQALMASLWSRLGDYSQSVTAYESALAIAEYVSEERPDETRHRRTLALRHGDLGAAYADSDSKDRALQEFEWSQRINEELLATDYYVDEVREELARTFTETGNILTRRGDRAKAMESYLKSLDFNEKLLESDLQFGVPKRNLAGPDLVEIYEEAVTGWRALLNPNEDDAGIQLGLALCEQNLGLVYAYYGSYDEARSKLLDSQSAYQTLTGQDGDAAKALELRAQTHYGLATVHSIQGSFEEAKSAYERSIAIASDLFKASTDGAATGHRLATYTLAMGRLHLYLEEYESASAQFKKMLEAYQRPSARDAVLDAEAGPIYPMYAQALQELSHLGRAKEALQLREAYIGLLGYFAQSESDDQQAMIRLADIYVKYGVSLRRDNQNDQARTSFKSALDILEALASNDPENTELVAKIRPIKLRLSRK